MDGPSLAAIVVPWDLATTRQRVAVALTAQGLRPRTSPLPRGYRPTPGEFVGLALRALPDHGAAKLRGPSHPNTAIVAGEVARVFHLAMWLSKSHPDEILVAWRRFAGFEACAKILWGGKPRWKDGEDPDHELGFALPQGPPVDLRPPGEARVPTTRSALDPLLARLEPLKDPFSQGGEGWLHKSSPIG